MNQQMTSFDEDLSHWGWGEVSEMPTRERKQELAEMAEAFLGFPERDVLEPTPLDDVELPAADVEAPLEFCSSSRVDRVHHSYGRGYRDLVRGFNGDYSVAPDVVARPEDESQVRSLLDWAVEEDVAVVPYGGGTSVVGGVECSGSGFSGVVSLDLREMDEVLEVDEISWSARIQAGATGPELNRQLEEHGLHLRHYPQSYEYSTLGGWIATRAGGHYATVYTRIDDFVEGVRMVAPDGEIETRRTPSTGAGPDPDSLVLGSEGALGVVTEAWTRVEPRPVYRAKAEVEVPSWTDAVEASRRIVQSGLNPANLRVLDREEAILNQVASRPLMVVGFESTDHGVETKLDRAVELAGEFDGEEVSRNVEDGSGESSGNGSGDDESGDWRSSFFEMPYLFNALVGVGVLVDTFETAVPWSRYPALHDDVKERVQAKAEEVCGEGFVSCRFTHVYPDGPAPYYTVLAPADVGREVEQWREIKETASDVLMEHEATITHHHAVGRVHRPWYETETSEDYREALKAAKRSLDPAGLMNPGALLDVQ